MQYIWTTRICLIFPHLVLCSCIEMALGNKPQVRKTPGDTVCQCVLDGKQENQDKNIQWIWSKSLIYQGAWEGLPPSCRWAIPWPLPPVHGEQRQLQYHLVSHYPRILALTRVLNMSKSLLKLDKQQNKAISILLCHPDINPQVARQILKLLQLWWKGSWICGHSECFSGNQSTFFWFTPVGNNILLNCGL